MVKVIGASKLLTCNEECRIITRGGVAFEYNHIIGVGDYDALCQEFGQGQFFESSILMPALINAHTHLEFSEQGFEYGSFGNWLDSVMAKRDEKVGVGMLQSIQALLKSGVGSIGAISSYGMDKEILADSALNVVYFCELIGTNEAKCDEIWDSFHQRVKESLTLQNERFKVGIGIHSPYSVMPTLLKKAVQEAKACNMPMSVHFLESREEKEWLQQSNGYFKNFYARINPAVQKSFYSPLGFLNYFEDLQQGVLFVHCTQAQDEHLQKIAQCHGSIVTCPRSNRLLGGNLLQYDWVRGFVPVLVATDSLASNTSLSLLEELRVLLFANSAPLAPLADELLLSVTRRAAKALGLNNGILEVGRDADISLFEIQDIEQSCKESLQWLLYAQEVQRMWLGGEEIF